MSTVSKGSFWWAKPPEATTLVWVEVTHSSDKVVQVREVASTQAYTNPTEAYKVGDIEFVEEAPAPEYTI